MSQIQNAAISAQHVASTKAGLHIRLANAGGKSPAQHDKWARLSTVPVNPSTPFQGGGKKQWAIPSTSSSAMLAREKMPPFIRACARKHGLTMLQAECVEKLTHRPYDDNAWAVVFTLLICKTCPDSQVQKNITALL
jgi:hypothetical protein